METSVSRHVPLHERDTTGGGRTRSSIKPKPYLVVFFSPVLHHDESSFFLVADENAGAIIAAPAVHRLTPLF